MWKLHSKQTTRRTRKGLTLPPPTLLAPFSLALLSSVPTGTENRKAWKDLSLPRLRILEDMDLSWRSSTLPASTVSSGKRMNSWERGIFIVISASARAQGKTPRNRVYLCQSLSFLNTSSISSTLWPQAQKPSRHLCLSEFLHPRPSLSNIY